ncbi:hypothetical protein ACET54_04465 [Aeromonas veronii]
MKNKSLFFILFFQITLSLYVCSESVGSGLYLLYSILIMLLLVLVFGKIKSSFLIVITVLFVLGNWLKITIHKIFKYPYIEPNGGFYDSDLLWDSYYLYSIAITVGFILFTLFLYSLPNKKTNNLMYCNGRHVNWISGKAFSWSIAFVFFLYIANAFFGFFRIGVARDLYLPFGLDAPATFLISIGAPVLLAYFTTRRCITVGRLSNKMLFIIALLSLFASITIFSRSYALLIMLPIIFGLNKSLSVNNYLANNKNVFIYVGLTIVATLILVSMVRIITYGQGVISQESLNIYFLETVGLVFDRWIGAESVMTAVMSNASSELFFKMLAESPQSGVNGIYQNLSGSHYVALDNMTFLTLPGFFGILTFSGNYALIVTGVVLMLLLGFLVEKLINNTFKGYFAIEYFISAAIAYHYTQMVYPRLFIPFIIQMIFFILFFYFILFKVRVKLS